MPRRSSEDTLADLRVILDETLDRIRAEVFAATAGRTGPRTPPKARPRTPAPDRPRGGRRPGRGSQDAGSPRRGQRPGRARPRAGRTRRELTRGRAIRSGPARSPRYVTPQTNDLRSQPSAALPRAPPGPAQRAAPVGRTPVTQVSSRQRSRGLLPSPNGEHDLAEQVAVDHRREPVRGLGQRDRPVDPGPHAGLLAEARAACPAGPGCPWWSRPPTAAGRTPGSGPRAAPARWSRRRSRSGRRAAATAANAPMWPRRRSPSPRRPAPGSRAPAANAWSAPSSSARSRLASLRLVAHIR